MTDELPGPGDQSMPMPIHEKRRAADAISDRLAARDQTKDAWRDAAPLHRIADAFKAQINAEAEIAAAVALAREKGYSWGAIGLALGVSRQAAQERYGRSPSDEETSE